MPLADILKQIQKKGKLPDQFAERSANDKTLNPSHSNPLNSRDPRTKDAGESIQGSKKVDSKVAKLKEARRLENESKKLKSTASSSSGQNQIQLLRKQNNKSLGSESKGEDRKNRRSSLEAANAATKGVKRSKFSDLMKKASQVDKSKLSVSIKSKSKSPETTASVKGKKSAVSEKAAARTPVPNDSVRSRKDQSKTKAAPALKPQKAQSSAPLPMRGPSSNLKERLKQAGKLKSSNKSSSVNGRQGSRYKEEYDDDDEDEDDSNLNDFVVSDDEEVGESNPPEYDRDEIWALFNRGRKRSYYDRYADYDSDDMEATGAEIFEEERKSRMTAQLEDQRELEEEQRLADLKRMRKNKR
ncbi:Piso0_002586 [Millerozyma farinosa CBS 7064]|uniref:Piso0_002586 protein n=1 Tax=Pichia sorbitophila (strain ATCC MYA-4447 / BCRC 22081 / CBS 7064 / NBRC 10061 / NRRL Y-12695) TaxID=559304 RepID=G8YD05_PICSO|nr:Piso0_002586 [Millerozyma farinosa CBS 7064]